MIRISKFKFGSDMNICNLTSYEISCAINNALIDRKWSIRKCCQQYNLSKKNEIHNCIIKPLDKDFVQRVKNNRFSLISDRVLELCDFLEINTYDKSNKFSNSLQEEFAAIENLIQKRPILEDKLKKLLTDFTDLLQLDRELV